MRTRNRLTIVVDILGGSCCHCRHTMGPLGHQESLGRSGAKSEEEKDWILHGRWSNNIIDNMDVKEWMTESEGVPWRILVDAFLLRTFAICSMLFYWRNRFPSWCWAAGVLWGCSQKRYPVLVQWVESLSFEVHTVVRGRTHARSGTKNYVIERNITRVSSTVTSHTSYSLNPCIRTKDSVLKILCSGHPLACGLRGPSEEKLPP